MPAPKGITGYRLQSGSAAFRPMRGCGVPAILSAPTVALNITNRISTVKSSSALGIHPAREYSARHPPRASCAVVPSPFSRPYGCRSRYGRGAGPASPRQARRHELQPFGMSGAAGVQRRRHHPQDTPLDREYFREVAHLLFFTVPPKRAGRHRQTTESTARRHNGFRRLMLQVRPCPHSINICCLVSPPDAGRP